MWWALEGLLAQTKPLLYYCVMYIMLCLDSCGKKLDMVRVSSCQNILK